MVSPRAALVLKTKCRHRAEQQRGPALTLFFRAAPKPNTLTLSAVLAGRTSTRFASPLTSSTSRCFSRRSRSPGKEEPGPFGAQEYEKQTTTEDAAAYCSYMPQPQNGAIIIIWTVLPLSSPSRRAPTRRIHSDDAINFGRVIVEGLRPRIFRALRFGR